MTATSVSRSNGTCAGQAVEEQAGERVDVGAGVDVAALDLLGRDVVDRPHELAGLGQSPDFVPPERLVSPKSVRYARRPSISTLPGLTSRWISAMPCAASSAEATWRQTSIAR